METTPYSSPLSLKRTIHPVGQGAFYSEQFFNKGVKAPLFTAVYDCGGQIACLKAEIDKISGVDILFISHFHDDHIKGLPFLIPSKKPKKIIFPRISPCRFLVDFVWNVTRNINTINSVRFMLKVLPMLRAEGDQKIVDDSLYIPIYGMYSLSVPKRNAKWEYIAFYDEDDSLDQTVEIKLKAILGLPDSYWFLQNKEYEDIATILKQKPDILMQVKQVYADTFRQGHNSYSMLVLSHRPNEESSRYADLHFDCLYSGDAEPGNVNDKATKFKPGYIQIPHHCSDNNHDSKIYTHRPIVFASVGTKNWYHHPGPMALNDICNTCSEAHFITEYDCSRFSRIESI